MTPNFLARFPPPPKKIMIRFVTDCRGSKYASSRPYVTHVATNGIRRRVRSYKGHVADSASCADFGQRATALIINRWAQANEHVEATTPRGGGETVREIGSSQAGSRFGLCFGNLTAPFARVLTFGNSC